MAYRALAPFTRPSLSTPYGGKNATRMRLPSASNVAGSPWVGNTFDSIKSLAANASFDAWQRNVVEPDNRRQQGVIDEARLGNQGGSPIAWGDQQGKWDAQFADRNFSEGNLSRIGDTAFRPTLSSLGRLPGVTRGDTSATLGQYGNSAQDVNRVFSAGSGDVNAGGWALSDKVSGGYEDLANRARDIVGGISDQETRDANRRFSEESAAETGRLVSQGLSGSGVGASVRGGIEGRRGDELRRIADQTAREQLDVESTFGGAGLAANQAIGLARLGEQGANVRFGTETARSLASDLAAKGLDAAQLNSQTGLESLRQQGVINDAQYRTLIDGLTTRLNTRTGNTERGVNSRLDVFGRTEEWMGGKTLVQPS